MKRRNTLLLLLLATEGAGLLAWALTRDGIAAFQTVPKSALTPPGWVFFVVWTVLYLLMAVGANRILHTEHPGKNRALGLFAVQLAVNFLWSIWFFGDGLYGVALLWLALLWVLVLAMLRAFEAVDKTAARLQWPYLVWVTFAGYLNAMVWLMNR